jgi:hypothetical protein
MTVTVYVRLKPSCSSQNVSRGMEYVNTPLPTHTKMLLGSLFRTIGASGIAAGVGDGVVDAAMVGVGVGTAYIEDDGDADSNKTVDEEGEVVPRDGEGEGEGRPWMEEESPRNCVDVETA